MIVANKMAESKKKNNFDRQNRIFGSFGLLEVPLTPHVKLKGTFFLLMYFSVYISSDLNLAKPSM